MRVSSSNYIQTSLRQLQTLQQTQQTQQAQLATGQKINSVQENATVASRVISGQETQKELVQYKANSDQANTIAQVSVDYLSSIKDLTDAAHSLAQNPTFQGRPESFENQLNIYIEDAINLANAQHDGEYLFGGTNTDTPPFEYLDASGAVTTDPASVASVRYNGATNDGRSFTVSEGVSLSPFASNDTNTQIENVLNGLR